MSDHLEISEDFAAEVVEEYLWVSKDDKVKAFLDAKDAIGKKALKFEDVNDMNGIFGSISLWVQVIVKCKRDMIIIKCN